MSWISRVLLTKSDKIDQEANRKVQELSYQIDQIFLEEFGIIDFSRFQKLPMFDPTHIKEGLMVSVFSKDKDSIHMTAHYAPDTKLQFHKHVDADERVVGIKGDGNVYLIERNEKTKEEFIREFDLREEGIINIKKNVFHSFYSKSEVITVVTIKKCKDDRFI